MSKWYFNKAAFATYEENLVEEFLSNAQQMLWVIDISWFMLESFGVIPN